jgi:hypothetical protein
MLGKTMNELYVLQIRYSGEEDDVFLFRHLKDAELKVFEYFQEEPSITIEELENWLWEIERGYFTITTQPIH